MSDLDKKIKELELKQAYQMEEMKENLSLVTESLKPSSLVKQAFTELTSSKNKSLQRNVIDSAIGKGAGFLARKIITFNSGNIFRKLTGYALQYVTTKLVTKKMPVVRGKINHKSS